MEDQTVENLIEKMAFLATAVDSYVEMILSDWRDRKHCLKSEKVGSMKKKSEHVLWYQQGRQNQ